MHSKGTLTTWKDEQGFGFATTEHQADKVFVHIKNFSHKTRRPSEGDQLVYDIRMDKNNRPQAVNIQFLHDFERKKLRNQRHNQAEEGKQLLSKIAAYPFILALLALCFFGKISVWIVGYYAVLSLLTFLLYWQDKNAAQKNQRRTPEKTLHQWSFFGGWIGALIAQLSLRHKSQKQEFRETFWLTVLGNLVLFGVFVYFTWHTPL